MQWDKAPTKIPIKYFDFANVFLASLATGLLRNTGINKHAIKLIKGKQPPYGPIYILSPVELKILKIYIKTHLKTGFIWSFKSPVSALILFNKKFDSSFYLYVNY